MDHLIIFSLILSLAGGTAAISQSIQLNRIYRLQVLRFFNIYFICANIIVLLNIISFYIMRNVSPISSRGTFILIVILVGIIGFTLSGIQLYFLGKAFWKMADKEMPGFVKILFALIFSSWIISFASGIIIYFSRDDSNFLLWVHFRLVESLSVIYILLSSALIILAYKIANKKKRQTLLAVAVFHSIIGIQGIIGLFFIRNIHFLTETVSVLLVNLTFLFCLKWFLTRMHGKPKIAAEQNTAIELLMNRNGISLREKEIIEMILRGLSNKEIEQKLFISPHTVKNHIYHIFHKLNINSRGQLINIINNSNCNQENNI